MFNGYVTFGYNADGYGDYTNGVVVELIVQKANTAEEALELLSSAAHDYYNKIRAEEDYEMSYPWNWGDLLNELDLQWLSWEKGIVLEVVGGTSIFPHDEIVVCED